MIARLCAAAAVAVLMSGPAMAQVSHTVVGFDRLDGWAADDHEAALGVFLSTCGDMGDDWAASAPSPATAAAGRGRSSRRTSPGPHLGRQPGALHRLLRAGARRLARPDRPLPPRDLPPAARGETRRRVAQPRRDRDAGASGGARARDRLARPIRSRRSSSRSRGRAASSSPTAGRSAWASAGGTGIPTAPSGGNSSGRACSRRTRSRPSGSSAGCARTRQAGAELLRHNPSFIFFREVNEVPPDRGPLGAMNRSVTALRTVAVDPDFAPLGAPVWIETDGRARCGG
jgi:membrane-bound lytic murein transglycosylase A